MKIFIEQTDERTPPRWEDIKWRNVEKNVRRLQERIYRATERQDWKRVRSLQKLLVRATSNKLLAIRRVTQENRGKRTPGVDGKVYDSPEARMALSQENLSLVGYRPQPVRRTYIPKDDGQRPLGIPTQKDRVMQALVKAALEPEWEARFEANSYGFRPGRCCMDAIEQIHTTLNREGSSPWMFNPASTPITRYVKVKGRSSPYDPALRKYWAERTKRAVGRQTYSRLRLEVLRAQDYRCGHCGILFQPDEDMDLHHIIPRDAGGADGAENRLAVHPYCHHQIHQRHGYKVLKA